jgi:4-hydroxy 2-oxovalerate aldolase
MKSNSISILDCTLRDGGYINEWNFGEIAVIEIANNLSLAGIEYIELGFLNFDKNRIVGKTIFNDFDEINKYVNRNSKSKFLGMIDIKNPFPLEKIPLRSNTSIDGLRIIFKKQMVNEALEYSKIIVSKGYELFIQLVATNFYSEEELETTLKLFSRLKPECISIVDTFGSIKRQNFLTLVELFDKYVSKKISLGYHGHNNLLQANENAELFINLGLERNIVVDSSIMGMGRGAGNLHTEVFAGYLNDLYGKGYNTLRLLDIVDDHISFIRKTRFWGYSIEYYLSGLINVHPDYAKFLMEKGTLSHKSISEIFNKMTQNQKLDYHSDIAEQIYIEYNKFFYDDRENLKTLGKQLNSSPLLVIGPGKSIITNLNIIKKYIDEHNPVIISLNFYSDLVNSDYIFITHEKRYKKLKNSLSKIIVTSNVNNRNISDIVINQSSFIETSDNIIMFNSACMFLNILYYLGVKSVSIAGLDGYEPSGSNYFSEEYEYYFDKELLVKKNALIKKYFQKMTNTLFINQLTDSKYL